MIPAGLSIMMAGDASAYSIGSMISYFLPNGSEKPIAFTSRALSYILRITANWKKKQIECHRCLV